MPDCPVPWRPTKGPPLAAERVIPGAVHPNRPEDPAACAATFGVAVETVQRWLDAGLPRTSTGLIDPILAADWITRHDRQACRALDRRWRQWFDWFQTAVDGRDCAPRTLSIRRTHTLFVPSEVAAVRWWIPRLPTTRNQRPHGDATCAHAAATLLPSSWRLDAMGPATMRESVTLRPRSGRAPAELVALTCELAASFQYQWRHHIPGDVWREDAGTCLDAAMTLGARVGERGWPWRLVSGVIARTALAGPHFWIEVEVEDGAGWVRLDPTLPAIVRTLDPQRDWRAWATTFAGGADTRLVTTVVGDVGAHGVPGGATAGGAVGEAVADGRNAWNCLDLPCGVCRWSFSARADAPPDQPNA